MKRILPFALLLAGCSTTEPVVEIRTVEVPVVRVEQCVASADIPARPAPLGRRPSRDARVLADLLLAQVKRWEGYGAVADPLLRGCAAE